MNSKLCFRCKEFDRFYAKGSKKYNKTKFGWCCKKQDTIEANDGCDKYVFKGKDKPSDRPIKLRLDELLTEISQLRLMLEEDRNGTDENETV